MVRVITIALLALAFFPGALFTPMAFLHRERDQAEARSLYDRVQAGMAKSELQEALRSGNYPNLKLRAEDTKAWYVSTPLLFGAGNWKLLIEFQAERVSAVRVRTPDDLKYPPPEAPPDKQ